MKTEQVDWYQYQLSGERKIDECTLMPNNKPLPLSKYDNFHRFHRHDYSNIKYLLQYMC